MFLTVTDPGGLTSTDTMTISATSTIYTQEQLDQMVVDAVATAVAPLEQTISEQNVVIDELYMESIHYYYGDFNLDNAVSISDYGWFSSNFGAVLDIDNDGDSFTELDGDCADNNVNIYPGAVEICEDGIDNDCDGAIGAGCSGL